MKSIKNNIKLIIGIIIGMIIVSGLSVYATYQYLASEIEYTDGVSVEDALNELYQNKKETSDETKSITQNGNQTLDKYYNKLDVNVPIPQGYIVPSGTEMISKNGTYDITNKASVNVNIPAQYAILETGQITTGTISNGGNEKCYVTLQNTYNSDQDARFIITSYTKSINKAAIYIQMSINSISLVNKSQIDFYVVNYGTAAGYCNINYAVIGIPSSLLN